LFLSYLHKAWQYFLRGLAVLFGTVVVLSGLVLGLIQLPFVQSYLLNQAEQQFNQNYYGTIELGRLDGFIPKSIHLHDAKIYAPQANEAASDSSEESKALVASLDEIAITLDLSDLLTRQVTITGLSLTRPQINLEYTADSTYSLFQALKARNQQTETPTWLTNIKLLAPQVSVTSGSLGIDHIPNLPPQLNIPQPLRVDSIQTQLFMELGDKQRYLDVERFYAHLPDMGMRDIEANGQLFNDDRFLEFNGFRVQSGNSSVQVSGELEGVNLYQRNWPQQFKQARFKASLDSSEIYLPEWKRIYPQLPDLQYPLRARFSAEGRPDSIWVNRLAANYNRSSLTMEGFLGEVNTPEHLNYDVNLRNLVLSRLDVLEASMALDQSWGDMVPHLQARGDVSGDVKQANLNLNVASDSGDVDLEGDIQWDPAISYTLFATGSDVRFPQKLWKGNDSELNFSLNLKGAGLEPRSAVGNGEFTLRNSSINGMSVDDGRIQLSFVDGFLEPVIEIHADSQYVYTEGWVDLSDRSPELSLSGKLQGINTAKFPRPWNTPKVKTSLNGQFKSDISGDSPEKLFGNVKVIWDESVVDSDSVDSGYLDIALNDPGMEKRVFTINSSLADVEISGSFDQDRLERAFQHWRPYFKESFKQLAEVGPTTGLDSLANHAVFLPFEYPVELNGYVQLKSLQPIRPLLPSWIEIAPGSELNVSVKANTSSFSSSGFWSIGQARVNSIAEVKQLKGEYQSHFTYGEPLRKQTNMDLTVAASQINLRKVPIDSLHLNLGWKQDSVAVSGRVDRLNDAVSTDFTLQSHLFEDRILLQLPRMFVGSDTYSWQNEGIPSATLYPKRRVRFDQVVFKNGDQQFEVDGVYSQNPTDTLSYSLNDMDLRLISDLIGGRVRFAGNLNGQVQTSALRENPYIVGDLRVNQGTVNGNTVGDVQLGSTYNEARNRFDTQLVINTDTVTYSDYIEANNGNRTHIVGNGWIQAGNFASATDTLYRMDFDFDRIDGWVVNVISPNIFEETRGKGDGSGYITGNFKDFDFNADFFVDDLYGRPTFLNTNYYMTGHVVVDRNDGVVFDSVRVRDGVRGNGLLYGSVDLNNFEPVKYMDIWLRLDGMEFLRKQFDRETPFYGTVAGSGLVRINGPNYNPFIRTVEPVVTESRSVFSIPLLEETELNQDAKFIQFVDEFNLSRDKKDAQNAIINNDQNGGAANDQNGEAAATPVMQDGEPVIDPSDLSFTELFEMDLQFIASPNSTVELIFDQIAGEVLTAQGSGQIQITLEDEVLQMFGRFNISGGEYQFVSGDIFTRRFFLEDGGSIQWEGDPYNARLNINTVYRARPTITSLINATSQNTVESTPDNQSRRIPIDLILEIRGTLDEVENNFYFRLPTNELEGTQNTALANQISLLNNEEQKLLQATSLLLTGNFLPIASSANQGVSDLRQNLSSGVVLSPLLSSQVNSLLKSNLSNLNLANNLDIDLNVTTFYELDLGIALRLFDDRLILRREGQITGVQGTNQSVLGDVGATYRINEALSISYFHRQDQLFSAVTDFQSAQATQPLNGIGLEAQVQFNTWSDLKNRIRRAFRKLFGRKEKAIREKQSGTTESESSGN
jgi:hypothetical protein